MITFCIVPDRPCSSAADVALKLAERLSDAPVSDKTDAWLAAMLWALLDVAASSPSDRARQLRALAIIGGCVLAE